MGPSVMILLVHIPTLYVHTRHNQLPNQRPRSRDALTTCKTPHSALLRDSLGINDLIHHLAPLSSFRGVHGQLFVLPYLY